MIFDKPSTRTRVSFDVAMRELGGETIMLTGGEMQLGRGETIADTARVLSRYVDAIMIRTLDHAMVARARRERHRAGDQRPDRAFASLPGDGRRDDLRGAQGADRRQTVAWIGDANNVLASWVHAAAQASASACKIATPPELAPRAELLDWAKANGADVIASTTDADDGGARTPTASSPTPGCRWATTRRERRHNLLMPYQVNARLMAQAKPDAIFMHCLPAHRGEEVTAEVIDGPQSVVFDEAENRLHAQKGILAWCFGGVTADDASASKAPPSRSAPAGDDAVRPFAVEALDVRGRAIQMGPALDAILARHDYPPPVSRLLAEAIVLAVLLGSSLKFDGKFILQTETDGPVDMLVVDYRTTGDIRAYARFDAERRRRGRARRRDRARRAPRQGHARHDHRPGRPHQPLPGRRAARRREPRGGRAHLFPPVGADPDPRPPRRRRDAGARGRRASAIAGGPAACSSSSCPTRRSACASRDLPGGDAPEGADDRGRSTRTTPGSRRRRWSAPSRTTS